MCDTGIIAAQPAPPRVLGSLSPPDVPHTVTLQPGAMMVPSLLTEASSPSCCFCQLWGNEPFFPGEVNVLSGVSLHITHLQFQNIPITPRGNPELRGGSLLPTSCQPSLQCIPWLWVCLSSCCLERAPVWREASDQGWQLLCLQPCNEFVVIFLSQLTK